MPDSHNCFQQFQAWKISSNLGLIQKSSTLGLVQDQAISDPCKPSNRDLGSFPSKFVLDGLDQDRPDLLRHHLVARRVGVDTISKHAGGKASLCRAVGDENGRFGFILRLGQARDRLVDGFNDSIAWERDDLVNNNLHLGIRLPHLVEHLGVGGSDIRQTVGSYVVGSKHELHDVGRSLLQPASEIFVGNINCHPTRVAFVVQVETRRGRCASLAIARHGTNKGNLITKAFLCYHVPHQSSPACDLGNGVSKIHDLNFITLGQRRSAKANSNKQLTELHD